MFAAPWIAGPHIILSRRARFLYQPACPPPQFIFQQKEWQPIAAKPQDAKRCDFSLIVPTYERRDLVCDAILAMAGIDFAGRFEIIVVVDGSQDGTADALRRIGTGLPLTIIEQANAGASAARNCGAKAAQGEILLFLDDDMICRSDILHQLSRCFAKGADALVGHIPLDPDSPPGLVRDCVGAWAQERHRDLLSGRTLGPTDILSGQLAIRSHVFAALGGFDGDFTAGGSYGNEDRDLGVRLLDSYTAHYCPDAVSFQRYIVTPAQNLRQCREAGQADVQLARKYPAHAEEIFAEHRPQRNRVRLFLRPLAHLPLFATLASAIVSRVTVTAYGIHPLTDRALVRIFALTREIAYWSGVGSIRN